MVPGISSQTFTHASAVDFVWDLFLPDNKYTNNRHYVYKWRSSEDSLSSWSYKSLPNYQKRLPARCIPKPIWIEILACSLIQQHLWEGYIWKNDWLLGEGEPCGKYFRTKFGFEFVTSRNLRRCTFHNTRFWLAVAVPPSNTLPKWSCNQTALESEFLASGSTEQSTSAKTPLWFAASVPP